MAKMMKDKEMSEKSGMGAKGGSAKMFGKMGADPMEAGVSAPVKAPAANNAAPKGGSSKMIGKQAADPQAAGVSGHSAGSSQSWGLPACKGRMAGPGAANAAKPA